MQNLNEEDVRQLRIILEAHVDVGAKFHGIMANTLFKAYKQSTKQGERLLLGLEIFCKLMQILEDVGLFCLTWLEAEVIGDPIGAFLNMGTGKIYKFYEKCSRGLTDQEVMTIHCLPSAEIALRAGVIEIEQVNEYQKKLEIVCESMRIVFKGFAMAYTEKPDGKIGNLKYGDVLNMFFNVKHGVKILWSKRPLSQAYFRERKLAPTFLPILVGPREVPEGSTAQRGLHFSGFDFTDAFVTRMNENCYYISNSLSKMAELRLDWLDNPGKSELLLSPYNELIQILHDAISRARLSNDVKQQIREKWPLK